MWSYTILCDTNDFSCKFSTNNSLLMLNPLSTALWPWESTKMLQPTFQNTLYFGILWTKLERKTLTASDNLSTLANFSLCLGYSVSTNSSNCCLASSASSAVNHLSLHNRSRRPWNFIFDHSFSSTIEFGDKAEVFLTMLYLRGHLSCNFWIRTMMTCLHSLLKVLFCSSLLSIKESDCFRAVPNLICSASNWLLDFAMSIFVTLSAVDASSRTSSFTITLIKLHRSSSNYLIEMEPLAYQTETVQGMALTFWWEIWKTAFSKVQTCQGFHNFYSMIFYFCKDFVNAWQSLPYCTKPKYLFLQLPGLLPNR